MRVLAGFLVAPLVPVVALSFLVGGPAQFRLVVATVAVVAYVITATLAVPLYMLMNRRGWMRLWHFLLGGALLGLSFDIAIYAFAALLSLAGIDGGYTTLRQDGVDLIVDGRKTVDFYWWEARRLLLYAATGVGAGVAFWLVAVRSNEAREPREV